MFRHASAQTGEQPRTGFRAPQPSSRHPGTPLSATCGGSLDEAGRRAPMRAGHVAASIKPSPSRLPFHDADLDRSPVTSTARIGTRETKMQPRPSPGRFYPLRLGRRSPLLEDCRLGNPPSYSPLQSCRRLIARPAAPRGQQLSSARVSARYSTVRQRTAWRLFGRISSQSSPV